MDSRDEALRQMYRRPNYTESLERDLAEAQSELRRLQRELAKERQRLAETSEAYTKTVSNLVRTVHENTVLRYEYQRLKQRPSEPPLDCPAPSVLGLNLSLVEVAAIRKAMARLHHPDVGGDGARMQAWNVVLDQIEEQI